MAERRIIKGWIVERQADGSLLPIAPASGQAGSQMPGDPTYQYKEPKAATDLQGSQLDNEYKRAQIDEVTRGKLPTGFRRTADGGAELIPGVPAPKDPNAQPPQTIANLRSVIDQINHIEALFNESQKGVGLGSIAEYLPTQENKGFDTAGAALGDMGTAAFKVPGLGSQSDADAARFVAANQPSRWDTDSQVQEKLGALRRRVDNTLTAMGQPAAQWGAEHDPAGADREAIPQEFLPQGALGAEGNGPQGGQGGPPMPLPDARGAQGDNVRVGDEAGVTSAGNGLTREPRLAGVGQELLSMVQAGRPRKEVFDYADKRFRSVGFPGISPGQAKALDYAVRMRAANPSKPVTNFVTGWENYEMVPDTNSGAGARTMGAIATSDVAGLPVGNTLTHFANAATAGLPTYMAGDRGADVMDASRRTMPGSSLVGDFAGSLAGMAGINGSAGALGKAGSLLTRGGGIGGDVLYNTARGGFENGPEGAVLGGVAGAVGNKIGSGVANTTGRVVRGISDPAVNYLASRGVPMTAGQLLGNRGVTGKLMNKLESLPGIGDSLAARRTESMEAFNRAALEDAGAQIGARPPHTGFRGAEFGLDAAGNAIGDAVAGVDVPIDPTGRADLATAIGNAQRTLMPDYAKKFSNVVKNRIAPITNGPNLTGDAYQQAMRGVKRYRSGASADGFEQDFRDSLTDVGDALTGVVDRQAGPQVSENLGKANTAFRDYSLIKSATEKAQAGSQSGTQEIFTPAQLQQAVRASKYAKSGTNEPFYELTKAGQEVLPSTVPDAGSAGRGFAGLLLPATLGGGAAAATYLDPKIGAPLAMLALLSSKRGAKIAQKALTGRGPAARAIGTKIIQQRRKAGLFGASTAGAMVPYLTQ